MGTHGQALVTPAMVVTVAMVATAATATGLATAAMVVWVARVVTVVQSFHHTLSILGRLQCLSFLSMFECKIISRKSNKATRYQYRNHISRSI
jgi:hypothetical protein